MIGDQEWVALGVVARPHGIKGELRLKVFNEDSDVLLEQDEVLVRMPAGEEHEVSVDAARRANDAILLKLFSVDDRNRADELRGAEICVKRSAFPPLEEGEFYVCDIKGARAVLADGSELGTVTDMIEYPAAMVLVVQGPSGTWEVPLTDAYVNDVNVKESVVSIRTLDELEPAKIPKSEAPAPASSESEA